VVGIVAGPPAAFEGGSGGTLTINRTGDLDAALVVNYAVSGTADSGEDYTALPGSVTIAAGSDRATLQVTALSDDVDDNNETVVVTLQESESYTLSDASSATITIVQFPTQMGQTIHMSSTITDYQAPYVMGTVTSTYTGMEFSGSRTFNFPWAQTLSFTTSGTCNQISSTQIRCEEGTTDLVIMQDFRGKVTATENGFIHPISVGNSQEEVVSDEITIDLSYPADYTFVSATVLPDEHNGNTLTWSRSNIAFLSVGVTFQTSQVQSTSELYLPMLMR
jgi:hypothetical protein